MPVWSRKFERQNHPFCLPQATGGRWGWRCAVLAVILILQLGNSGCCWRRIPKWARVAQPMDVATPTVEQLFFEAVSEAYPEQTLDIQSVAFDEHRPPLNASVDDTLPRHDSRGDVPPLVPPSEAAPLEVAPPPPPAPQPPPPPLSSWRAGEAGRIQLTAFESPVSFERPILRTASHQPAEQPLVNEFFEDTDVRQAIQSMATQAGISVIMDDQVGGIVSIYLEDEPFESALEKTLLPLGMVSKRQDDGSYLIGLPDPASPLFPLLAERRRYDPLHVSPKLLVDSLAPRSRPFVRSVEAQNQIVVEAPAKIAEAIYQELVDLDQPSPQVMLEAIICVVEPNSGFRFGLDWGRAVELNGQSALDLGLTGLSFSGTATRTGWEHFFSDFAVTSAFIQLLEQNGYLSIRASPRVMALNGQRAEISIVRQTFFSTQPLVNDLIFRQDIREVEAGIDMAIIPTVRGNNVHVQIEKAEVSEDIRSQTTDRNLNLNPFPIINRRRVTTNVTVEDGKTIVIGGLVARQTVDRISQIPGLRKSKRLGRLFQRIEKQEQEAEVVIFISPKIIRTPE